MAQGSTLKAYTTALVLLTAAASLLSGQQPTFRARTEVIEVDAVVTDGQGNVVRGLTKDDFTILDDGKPQPIAAFTFIDIPIERAADPAPAALPSLASRPGTAVVTAPRVEPDVSTNERPFDGRVYILILDDLHTTPEWSLKVRTTARLFLERSLGDNDLIAIVYASRGNAGSGFTNDRSILLAAVDAFTGLRPLTPQVEGEIARGAASRLGPTLRLERENNAARMLGLIRRISNWAEETLPGRRKALLLFSEGVEGFTAGDFDGGDLATGGQAEFRARALETRIGDQVKNAIAAAARGNVSIYPVDARGLDNLSITNGHLFLSAMASETGGTPVLRMNDFTTGFERIVRNASSYYALAYMPPATAKAGTYHNITVKVNRPGLQVRARRGYETPDQPRSAPVAQPLRAGAASAALTAAINSTVPASDVKLAIFTVSFRGQGKNTSVLIGTELSNLALGELDASGRLPDEVELTAVVTGLRKVVDSRTNHLRLALTPERAQQTGGAVRVLYRFDLSPGTYQVRVAVKDGNSGRIGSIVRDLEVPDLGNEKTPLAMSGIVLTSARATELVTTGDEERLTSLLGTAPAALRQFSPHDELVVFAEVYDRVKAPHQDVVSTRVINQAGQIVLERADAVAPVINDAQRNDRGTYEHQVRLPLTDVLPGRYVLRIEVSAQVNPGIRVSRGVPFTVVP
ncbi:MAG: VWA domain-containing protein [Vicinamibacterales bacterium]